MCHLTRDYGLELLPVTSTTLPEFSEVQYASIQVYADPFAAMHAPMAPQRMTTEPWPSGPIPISRNRRHASSTSSFVGTVVIESSDKASSALGLSLALSIDVHCSEHVQTHTDLKMDTSGSTF